METDTTRLGLIDTGASSAPVDEVSPIATLHRPGSVRLLSLDAHGRVLDWINWQDAACLYARDAVAWTLGDPCLHIHGGNLLQSDGRMCVEHVIPFAATVSAFHATRADGSRREHPEQSTSTGDS